jgi:Na+-transporting NADH:ubiquinone oxidoreductase subunit C
VQQYSNKYIFGFTALVCLGCSMMISIASVSLRDRQERNKALYQKRSVLQACLKLKAGESAGAEKVEKLFETIEAEIIELKTGKVADMDPAAYSVEAAMAPAPGNPTGLPELPAQVKIYKVMEGGSVDSLVLPITGKGLWSTLKGYIAIEADGTTIRGITFYEHGETPGLGGEVDNPKWKAMWKERKAYDENGNVAIAVEKGQAGPPSEEPHRIDALSGATLTSRGVHNMVRYWLGENGYGPYLKQFS